MSDLFLSNKKNPFIGFSKDWLEKYVANVKNLIHTNSEDYVAPYKNGKRLKLSKTPWMLPIWKNGLELAQEELKNRA